LIFEDSPVESALSVPSSVSLFLFRTL
jgi:hypothetical protein